MIRRYLRGYLTKFHELLDARDAPHSVAGGTAIGVFFGFIPILGFKTLAAIGIAKLTRCSMLAAAIGVTLHDVFWWMWPLILRWQFQVGFWMLSHPHELPPPLQKTDFKLSEILQWDNLIDIGLPLTVGGIVFAIPAALITYGVILFVVKLRSARRLKEESAHIT
jgi:hypothetical protein